MRHEGRVGKVIEEVDSDLELKLRWADGSESEWISYEELVKVGEGDWREALRAEWKEGDFASYEGRPGMCISAPDEADLTVKLRWANNSTSECISVEELAKISKDDFVSAVQEASLTH